MIRQEGKSVIRRSSELLDPLTKKCVYCSQAYDAMCIECDHLQCLEC